MPNALNLEGIALTRDQGHWRQVAEKLAREVLAPTASDVDRYGEFPHANIKTLKENKLLTLMVSERWGGPADLSVFMIEGKDPNVEPKGIWDGMGLRGNSSRPVYFNHCRVPRANRLGEPTAGFSFMMAYSLPIYFVGLASVYLGIAQAAF